MEPALSPPLATSITPAMETNTNVTAPAIHHRDYFSRLPHELLLMIISHHPPVASNPPPNHFLLCRYEDYRHFLSYEPVLALSRTCRQLHHFLTPELIRGLLSTEDDPLGFAIKLGHLNLGVKLLKEGLLPASEERLVRWVDHVDLKLMGIKDPGNTLGLNRAQVEWLGEVRIVERKRYAEQVRKAEVVRKAVVELLLEMGAGKRLGREWHAMMGLHWEPGAAKTRKKPERKSTWEVLFRVPPPRGKRTERRQVKYVEDEYFSETEEECV